MNSWEVNQILDKKDDRWLDTVSKMNQIHQQEMQSKKETIDYLRASIQDYIFILRKIKLFYYVHKDISLRLIE